jgi:hypothetical protein
MARTFQVSLYTPQDISHEQTTQALWRILDDRLIDPQRFDSVERAKIEFTPSAFSRASELYADEGMLFVRGLKDSFTGMFMQQHGDWGMWTFWWDANTMKLKGDHWLEWIIRLCEELPPFYGLGCSVAEYDAKHTVVENVPGGTATGMMGVSAADFHEFLPGIYWLTIFGLHLAEHFGAKLKSLPGTRPVALKSGGTAVVLDEPAVPQDLDARLQTESHLRELLGPMHFFDRTQPNATYQAVPELRRALRDLNS